MNISDLARTRAEAAARYEAIGAEKSSRDPEERAAQNDAYRKAEMEYRKLEAAFQKATALLTADELESVLRVGRRERAA
jgi:hypothetical protein